MIKYSAKIYIEGNPENFHGSINSRQLIINNTFFENILNHFESLTLEDVKGWDIFIVCERIDLIVDEFDLTEKVAIHRASDGGATFNLVKSKSSSIHLVGLDIDLIQTYDSHVFLANCNIKKFDYDIETFTNRLRKIDNVSKLNDHHIDIRRCHIYEFSTYSYSEL